MGYIGIRSTNPVLTSRIIRVFTVTILEVSVIGIGKSLENRALRVRPVDPLDCALLGLQRPEKNNFSTGDSNIYIYIYIYTYTYIHIYIYYINHTYTYIYIHTLQMST